MKTVRGLVLGALIGALVMTLAPAGAAPLANSPSGDGVQPTIIPHFGGDDCTDPLVGTEATHSLVIPSPMTRSYTDPATGVVASLVINTSQRTVNFTITTPGWVAFDVVVKGGTNSNHYDYLASAVGPQTSDTVLHSPPKGNRYDNLSHVTICYDSLLRCRSRAPSSTTVIPMVNWTTTTVRSKRVWPTGPSRRSRAANWPRGPSPTPMAPTHWSWDRAPTWFARSGRQKRHHSPGSNRPPQETPTAPVWDRTWPRRAKP